MSDTAMRQAELVVTVIAQTAVDNETYFCELDAVVGDGDFGYSLARGFENVLSGWDDLQYDDPGEPARVLANRGAARPGDLVTLADLDACRTQPLSEKETV